MGGDGDCCGGGDSAMAIMEEAQMLWEKGASLKEKRRVGGIKSVNIEIGRGQNCHFIGQLQKLSQVFLQKLLSQSFL